MAVLNFPKIAGNTVPMVNAATGAASTSAYAEYVVKEVVEVGIRNGGRRGAISQFGVVAATQDECDTLGGEIAQIISDCSLGGPVSLYKKMGTYVKSTTDIGNSPIQQGNSKYAILTWTNGLLEGETGTPAQTIINGQVYVPYCDITRLSAFATAIDSYVGDGKLARARVNQAGNGFEVGISRGVLGIKLNDYNSLQRKELTRTDSLAGITDGVLADRALPEGD